jgi:hypothetical protein
VQLEGCHFQFAKIKISKPVSSISTETCRRKALSEHSSSSFERSGELAFPHRLSSSYDSFVGEPCSV